MFIIYENYVLLEFYYNSFLFNGFLFRLFLFILLLLFAKPNLMMLINKYINIHNIHIILIKGETKIM